MDTGESTKETVKPSRGECRLPAVPVVTMLVCFFTSHARPWVRAAHPAFPAPSIIRGLSFKTRARSRRGECGILRSARAVRPIEPFHREPSGATRALILFLALAQRHDGGAHRGRAEGDEERHQQQSERHAGL